MPNITEFNAGDLAIRPSETGVEALAAAGRRAGAFYNQEAEAIRRTGSELGRSLTEAGDVAVNYETHQQVSAGAATGAQLFSDQLEKKDAAIKAIDPNDPLYGQKVQTAVKQWREESLEPALQQFAGGFTTTEAQKWAQSFVDRTRDTMFVHSTADIQTAAGIGIHNSARTLVNTATATAFRDPTMLASQIDLVDHGVTGLVQSNPVKGIEAGKVQSSVMESAKEQIVKAAVQGAIMSGGNWRAIAENPDYSQYVNAAEMAQFDRAAKTQARASAAYDAQTKFYNTQVANAKVSQDSKQIFQNNVAKDSQGDLQINPQFFKDILNLPVNNPGASSVADVARTYLRWGEKMQSGPATESDAQTDANLKSRLFDAQNPTSELDIRKAEADGKMTVQNGAVLSSLIAARDAAPIKDPTFNATMQAVRRQTGNANFTGFLYSFLPQYQKGIADGTLPPNALDLNDPKSLISQSLKAYKPSLGAAISANGGIGAPAPKSGAYVIPGQTMNDIDERPVAGKQYAMNEPKIPQSVYDALSAYAQGGSAASVHKALPSGWSIHRRLNSEYEGIEVLDPAGNVHFIPNGDL